MPWPETAAAGKFQRHRNEGLCTRDPAVGTLVEPGLAARPASPDTAFQAPLRRIAFASVPRYGRTRMQRALACSHGDSSQRCHAMSFSTAVRASLSVAIVLLASIPGGGVAWAQNIAGDGLVATRVE